MLNSKKNILLLFSSIITGISPVNSFDILNELSKKNMTVFLGAAGLAYLSYQIYRTINDIGNNEENQNEPITDSTAREEIISGNETSWVQSFQQKNYGMFLINNNENIVCQGNSRNHCFGLFEDYTNQSYEILEFLSLNLLNRIINNQNFFSNLGQAIAEGYENIQNLIQTSSYKKFEFQTSMATTVFIRSNTIFISHLGTSRVILSKNGEALQLTKDHILDGKEINRWIQKGAKQGVGNGLQFYKNRKKYEWEYNVSRSFAGKELKDFLYTDPDNIIRDIEPEDRFLILASSNALGKKTLRNKDAVNVVNEILDRYPNDYDRAAQTLAGMISEKTDENIGIIIIDLDKYRQ